MSTASDSISKTFDPCKLYIKISNFGQNPPEKGSFLNEYNTSPDPHTWLEIISQDDQTITVLHPDLPTAIALDRNESARWQIRMAIKKLTPPAKPKKQTKRRSRSRSRSGQPSKKTNYAARVVAASHPFDSGMRATAQRMDELKEENGELPAAETRQIPFHRNGRFVTMIEVN